MNTPFRIAVIMALGLPMSASARLDMLAVGKFVRFESRVWEPKAHGIVVVGRDRALRTLHDPTCPTRSRFALVSRVESAARREVAAVELDCAKWTARGRGWHYRHGGAPVRSIRYERRRLRIVLGGPDIALQGPVNLLQADLTIGDTTLRARFQSLVTDVKDAVVTWRTSPNAAAGETAFWDVILGDASSEERQQAALSALTRAVTSHPHDGRSRFLLGMLRLYRFRQAPPGSEQALTEIRERWDPLESTCRHASLSIL